MVVGGQVGITERDFFGALATFCVGAAKAKWGTDRCEGQEKNVLP